MGVFLIMLFIVGVVLIILDIRNIVKWKKDKKKNVDHSLDKVVELFNELKKEDKKSD